MQLIALTGLKQSGKTTAADYLVSRHGFVKINFKDALAQEIKENFPALLEEILKVERLRTITHGIKPENLTTINDLFFFKPPLMRLLYQNYGTEVRRRDDAYYWIDKWKEAITESEADKIVVDDARFLNEAETIKDLGGYIIQIVRPNTLGLRDDHRSETEMESIKADYTINNNGYFGDLYANIERALKEKTIL